MSKEQKPTKEFVRLWILFGGDPNDVTAMVEAEKIVRSPDDNSPLFEAVKQTFGKTNSSGGREFADLTVTQKAGYGDD